MLERIAACLPLLKILVGGEDYLDRYYVAGPKPSTGFPPGMKLRLPWLPWTIYLHKFYRGDLDRALHNHPWNAVSLILVGGYREEYLDGETVRSRTLKPGQVNVIRTTRFHRVDLLGSGPTWTLVIHGPRVQKWGFWIRETKTFIPHEEYNEV